MTPLDHQQLCQRAAAFLMRNGFSVAVDDRFRALSTTGEQPDTLGFRNGVSCLVEVKTSRSDFLADTNKPFRHNDSGMGDWRFYLAPQGLLSPSELPVGWGLLEWQGRKVVPVSGWPSNTQWCSEAPFKANMHAERDWLTSALRRVKDAGHLGALYTKKTQR